MAAELSKETDVEVTKVRGGLGELSVHIDGEKVIDSNRLWYPRAGKVIWDARALLAK